MSEQTPDEAREPYVFVTYAQADGPRVQEELAWLKGQGINFAYDETVASGDADPDDFAYALEGAVKLLFFVSDAAMASEECRREIAFGSLKGLEVLQVFLDEGGLTDDIRNDQHLGRAYQVDGDATHRNELAVALKERVTRS